MRRTFDSKFKAKVALEALKEEKTIAEIVKRGRTNSAEDRRGKRGTRGRGRTKSEVV